MPRFAIRTLTADPAAGTAMVQVSTGDEPDRVAQKEWLDACVEVAWQPKRPEEHRRNVLLRLQTLVEQELKTLARRSAALS